MAEQVRRLDTENPRIRRNMERQVILQRVEQIERWLRITTWFATITAINNVALWVFVILH